MNHHNSVTDFFARTKQLAVLIDPDDTSIENTGFLAQAAQKAKVDYFFIGGSLLSNSLDEHIKALKSVCDIPVIIFPGNAMQFSPYADAILFISLVSGRNPDFLIGHHVISAPMIKKSGLEVLPTAYILIKGTKTTAVEYMSNTTPIPADKPEIVTATALASEMMGLKYTYLEAGSGSAQPVPAQIIQKVKNAVQTPVIVGGGIRSADRAKEIYNAGADLIVVGNAIEENYSLIREIACARDSIQHIL